MKKPTVIRSKKHSESCQSSTILIGIQEISKSRRNMLKSKEHMRPSSMSPKESPMICTENKVSNNCKKIHSEKVVTSGLKCGSLFINSIQVVKKSTASEEDKYVSIAKELVI